MAITRFSGYGVERLGDQVLGDVGTVRVGGVDQGHAVLDDATEQFAAAGGDRRVAPDPVAGDPHRAEAEATDLEVAAEEEGVAVGHAGELTAGRESRSDRRRRTIPPSHGSATAMLIPLGYGKFVRADRVFALVPLEGPDRGDGRRTLVYVEGIEDPIVASRSEGAIERDVASALGRGSGRSARWVGAARPRRAVLNLSVAKPLWTNVLLGPRRRSPIRGRRVRRSVSPGGVRPTQSEVDECVEMSTALGRRRTGSIVLAVVAALALALAMMSGFGVDGAGEGAGHRARAPGGRDRGVALHQRLRLRRRPIAHAAGHKIA